MNVIRTVDCPPEIAAWLDTVRAEGTPLAIRMADGHEIVLTESDATAAAPDEKTIEERLRRAQETVRRYNALPIIDPRSPDEILGYDEYGLPS